MKVLETNTDFCSRTAEDSENSDNVSALHIHCAEQDYELLRDRTLDSFFLCGGLAA